jgi:RNA polymerase sigma factor (TIGR02999 family)
MSPRSISSGCEIANAIARAIPSGMPYWSRSVAIAECRDYNAENTQGFARFWGSMSDVTHILSAIEQGDPHAAELLLPLVYDELRKLAAERMAREKPGQTLQATALVHEAYVRLVGDRQGQHWDHRGHFFAAAAEAMRRILVDDARRKQAIRHGGGRCRVALHDHHRITQSPDDLLALHDALSRFASEEPAKAELVKLRFFAGLSTPEAASALGVSVATAERWWAYARTWLFSELQGDSDLGIPPTP